MSFASASAVEITDWHAKLTFRFTTLTGNDVLEEGLETRMVGTHRVLQYQGHGTNALVAQLVVDEGQILEAIVPKCELCQGGYTDDTMEITQIS